MPARPRGSAVREAWYCAIARCSGSIFRFAFVVLAALPGAGQEEQGGRAERGRQGAGQGHGAAA